MLLVLFSFFVSFIGKLYREDPVKKINKLDGYRSRRAMKNQENWDKAQRISGHYLKLIGTLFFILGIILTTLEIGLVIMSGKQYISLVLIVELAIFIFSYLFLKIQTEKRLN